MLLAPADTPKTWFGPVAVTFPVMFSGNPYDPEANDVRVRFIGERGQRAERLAYFDAAMGAWRATLVAEEAGTYRAVLVRNGAIAVESAKEGIVEVRKPMPRGFVRVDPNHPNRFRYDDLTPYYPIGVNLGWQNPAVLPLTDQIAKFGKSGINWTRVWACNWDGKNPWWPGDAVPDGHLWEPALSQWERVGAACDASGVFLQMVLFHHGSFSSRVNPNWPDHPWNKAKGGFLEDAANFFTDAEAKRRAKMWLRYAVARYGASNRLLAWELFNEVEWVDARYADRWADIEAWHREMADYLRSIDPYHHPVTSSSTQRAGLNAALDYVQPHTYPKDVGVAISSAGLPTDKPGFFGEYGPSESFKGDARPILRDGIYAAMLSNHAGAAMFWYWETVEQQDLYREYSTARYVLDESRLAEHPGAHRVEVALPGAKVAALAEVDWLLARVRNAPIGEVSELRGLPLANGTFEATLVDLDTGKASTHTVTVASLAVKVKFTHPDQVLILRRR